MRLALIVAFLGSLTFAAGTVEARPKKATAASKQKAKKPAKKKLSKKKVVEEAPVVIEEEETKPVAKAEPAPRRSGAAVAQASDDEVPRNEPGKKK